mmetsp:Transcript_115364/g.337295  ORF Transcript_115364/g.337295 Transcript_115364/m.337295 type:complete len:219 (-) Transcript_115364:1529-2185(-)
MLRANAVLGPGAAHAVAPLAEAWHQMSGYIQGADRALVRGALARRPRRGRKRAARRAAAALAHHALHVQEAAGGPALPPGHVVGGDLAGGELPRLLRILLLYRGVHPDFVLALHRFFHQLLQVNSILVHDFVEDRPADSAGGSDRREAGERRGQDDRVGADARELQDDYHRRQGEAEAGGEERDHAKNDAGRHDVLARQIQNIAGYSAHAATQEAAAD